MKKKELKARIKELNQFLSESETECQELLKERRAAKNEVDNLLDRSDRLINAIEEKNTTILYLEKQNKNKTEELEKYKKIQEGLGANFMEIINEIKENQVEYLAFFSAVQRNYLFREAAAGDLQEEDDFKLEQLGQLLASI